MTGKDYGPPPKEKKPKNVGAVTEASDKNKEKRAKKAEEKRRKAEEKERKRAERAAREKAKADKLAGVGADNFGDLPLIRSQTVQSMLCLLF